jgi:hypothetical protein
MAWPAARARAALIGFALVYAALWALAVQRRLHGALLTVPHGG